MLIKKWLMLDSMLNQLLFLGQIPGTNFEITFSEYLLVVDLFLVWFLLEHYHHLSHKIRYGWLYSLVFVAVKRARLLNIWQHRLSI